MPSRSSTLSDTPSKAGITTSESGERVIASSTRADGSVRKEIRVRPGYRPPEDVEVYKNRTAEAFKNRGKGPIPGAYELETNKDESMQQVTAASTKNAKRREARKKAAANASETKDDAAEVAKRAKGRKATENGAVPEQAAEEVKDPEAEKEKEAKKLAKKIRQARELQDKKEQGDALLPEQLDKIIRINELIRQLDQLGFGSDGERKAEVKGEAG